MFLVLISPGHLSLLVCALAVLGLCTSQKAFAWNKHTFHAQWVRQVLAPQLTAPAEGSSPARPQSDRERGGTVFSERDWEEFVKLYCYYPDWGGSRSGQRPGALWDYFRRTQAELRLQDTHSRGTTVRYFRLLLEALAGGDSRHAALWSGCLTHVIGDAAAANHSPVLAYLIYGYSPMGMTLGRSGPSVKSHEQLLDVAGVSEDPLGRKYIEQELKEYRPRLLADNALDAAVRLQLLLHEGFLLALQEETLIARGFERWVTRKDPQGRELLMKGMARLVARCTRDAGDTIYTAWMLGRKKQTVDVDRALAKAEPAIERFRSGISLSDVSTYKEILHSPKAAHDRPAVGLCLAIPPIWWVSPGCVDLQLCYFLRLIAGTLREQKTAYVTLDINRLPPLDPHRVPVLIVPSYKQADGLVQAAFEKRIRDYYALGGRVLFLGGRPQDILKPLSDHFIASPEGDGSYPIKGTELGGKKVLLTDPTNGREETLSFGRVMVDFTTRGHAPYILKAGPPPNIQRLLVLESGDKHLTVSAAYREKGSFKMIYAPWYVFMPCSLSTTAEVHDVDQPRLDAAGQRILNLYLKLLRQGDG